MGLGAGVGSGTGFWLERRAPKPSKGAFAFGTNVLVKSLATPIDNSRPQSRDLVVAERKGRLAEFIIYAAKDY